jgi:hypothetical protein
MSKVRRVLASMTAKSRINLLVMLCLCLGMLVGGFKLAASRAAQLGQPGAASADGVWLPSAGQNSAQGRAFRLNSSGLLALLNRAPLETTTRAANSPAVITLPLPTGQYARFRLVDSPVLMPGLAAKFPDIKSYSGQGVDDPAATVRLSWSPRGLAAFILGRDYSVQVFTPDARDNTLYLSALTQKGSWTCDTRDLNIERLGRGPVKDVKTSVGSQLRVYRIAIATTQEYTNDPQLGGGSVGGVVASLNGWLNGVNAIYETELAIRLTLVDNTQIIRTAEPDGFTNANASTMLGEVGPILGAEVGSANYDIGHVFAMSAGGGNGVAGLGVVCDSANVNVPGKGVGASRLSGPVLGSSGMVSLIAHEFGHQFGAAHTFNSTVGTTCGGQRSPATAWESGSGTTIMSYNGSCAAGAINDNLSGAENTRFHNGSFTQINNYLATTNCAQTLATNNAPPNVSARTDRIIPKNTPFTLDADASDPDPADAANLTYNWEQVDAGGATFNQDGSAASYSDAGDPNTTTRPIFRPFPSNLSPTRFFPSLNFILNNANTPPAQTGGLFTAENLPQVERALTFRVTVRDNRAGGAGVSDDEIILTVAGNAGPFQVTAPNTNAVTWAAGSQQTVTWDVNNTDAAPVSEANIRILLSLDGGQSYNIVLAGNTANDGSEQVTLPANLNTAQARVRIEAATNIFFDVSDQNFTINAGAGCPFVTSIAPAGGAEGSTVTINGSGFTGVTDVTFNSNQAGTNLNVVSDTQITVTVPNGAVSGPLTLTKPGCPAVQTDEYLVCTNPPAVAQVDDGTFESASGVQGSVRYIVNRLTPQTYPATLTGVQIRFDAFQGFPQGTNFTVLAAAHLSGNANINNTSFQMVPTTIGTLGQFVTYPLSSPITITSGDFVVGFMINNVNQFEQLIDTTAPHNGRSYESNNGNTFTVITADSGGGPDPVDLPLRAQYLTGCTPSSTCPTVNGFTPANGAPFSTVTINGMDFTGVTEVVFGNNASAFFDIVNDTQISAIVPIGALSGPIKVRKTNCADVETTDFTVDPNACPVINNISPASAAPGATVTITGTNLTAVSVLKFSNNAAAFFTVDSDTQITATVPNDAAPGPITLSKAGCPNVQTSNFTPCGNTLTLQVDDGSLEAAVPVGTGTNFYVNRLTPVAYPATLNSVQLRMDQFQGVTPGTAISIVAGNSAAGGANINNTTLQTTNTVTGPVDQFNTYNLANPLTINAGDFVIGFSMNVANGQFPGSLDTTAPHNARSYESQNGTTFTLIDNNGNNADLLIRGLYTTTCQQGGMCPAVNGIAPNNGAVGATVTITGTNFTNATAVKFTNNVTAQFTVDSDTQITATVPTGAVTGVITISKTGCPDAQTDPFTVNPTCPAITVNPANPVLTDGTDGMAYTLGFTQTGGAGNIVWTNPAGTLPGGLTLNAMSGVLSGVPNAQGTFNFTIRATDENNCTGERQYTLTINPAGQCPTVTVSPASPALGTGAVGTAYSQSFTQTGGSGAITWSQPSGALPAGLTLNPATGELSGTPTTPGTSTFTIRATDANNCTGERSYVLVINAANCAAISFLQPGLPPGRAGDAYNQNIAVSPFGTYTFTVVSGTLPAGLTLANDGTLAGTPTAAGTSTLVIKATEANGCANTIAYTLIINPATCPAIEVGNLAFQLPPGSIGIPYPATTIPVTPADNYTFAIAGGQLPAGMTFNTNTGELSGTPTMAFEDSIFITATNGATCVGGANLILQICPTITISPAGLTAGTVGTPYTATLTSNPAADPLFGGWEVVVPGTGTLPPGLALSQQGELSGTPTQAGSFPFTVEVLIGGQCRQQKQYTLVINNGGCPTITVSPVNSTLPPGTMGSPYTPQTFTQTGGTGPITWSNPSGGLPAGLTLDPGTGVLSGTPTVQGTFNFTIQATDANQCTGARAYTLVINPMGCPTITVSPNTATLTAGTVGTAYTQTFMQTGGAGAITWSVSAGSLPGGLTLNPGTGVLSGTPSTANTFNFTIRATDANQCTGQRQYTLTINPAPGNGLQFYPLPAPVRLLDTRAGEIACTQPSAPIAGQTSLTQMGRGLCNIPANAVALTGNLTTVQSGGGYLTLYPSNAPQPTVASTNYGPNEIINNVFTVGLGPDGAFKIFAFFTTEVVVDVTGYYAPPSTGGLYFHPLPKPIRLLETRAGEVGCNAPGAPIQGGVAGTRTQQARLTCDGVTIPAGALAIVGNATTVGPQAGGYLTLFPANAAQPLVASSNYNAGQVVNGPFSVGLAPTGEFNIFSFATTDLVVDVLGYYSSEANDVNGAGLLFNPLPKPVRLLETRANQAVGCYLPGLPLISGVENTQPARGACDGVTIPANALGVVGNATVVTPNAAGYLTLWPSTALRPLVATANYNAGDIGNRHFIVGLGAGDGAFKLFSSATTELVIDLSGYFAP